MPSLFKCSKCGRIVAQNARFCMGCGTPGPIARHPNSWRTAEPPEAIADLLATERTTQAVVVPRPAPAGKTFVAAPEIMTPINRPVVVVVNQKSSGLAAVLSFFWCGLGQIYNGEILKGVGLMIVYPIVAWIGVTSTFVGLLAAMGASAPDETAAAGGLSVVGLFFSVLAAGMWLYGMINAYRAAETINRRQAHVY